MLTIRLSRVGKKKKAEYRLIISEKQKDPWGKALEYLGYYNPRTEPATIDLKEDRIKYWISKGAQVSDTVNNLLIQQKVIDGKKIKPTGIKPTKKKDKGKKPEKEKTKTPEEVKDIKDGKPAEQAKTEEKPVEAKGEKKSEKPEVESKEELAKEQKDSL